MDLLIVWAEVFLPCFGERLRHDMLDGEAVIFRLHHFGNIESFVRVSVFEAIEVIDLVLWSHIVKVANADACLELFIVRETCRA